MEPSSQLVPGDSEMRIALATSHLRSLPGDTLADLIANATRSRVAAGATIRREGDEGAHFQLVLSGLLRVFVTAKDGRTLTVRYCRPGSLMGTVSLFAAPFSMPASIQAVTDASILSFPPALVRGAAERDALVARALLNELSQRVLSFIAEIPGSAFASVRQRIARHLLDLASAEQNGSELVATVSQQELADAVGTVREVVVRVLREFREQNMIETGRSGITLVNPERLSAEVYPLPVTRVPDQWDHSR